ncbi:MAG: YciI family protein [Candidatus Dormibacteria bacterium]
MEYMVLLSRGEWEDNAPEDERNRTYQEIQQWWGRLAAEGKIVGGHQLQHPDTATTVVLRGGKSTVVDGPFMEAKEVIGGYGIFDVADLDEAIALVRTFPSPSGAVEIRPVVVR